MYVVPLVFVVLFALAIFFSPILAVVLLVVFLIGLGIFKFLGPGTQPEHAPRPNQTSRRANAPEAAGSGEEEGGLWGETWPEQGQGEEPSS
jgi:hypothetical protein